MNADLAKLRQLLKNHDWYYNYSDDHAVWKRGEARSIEIREQITICQDLGYEDEARKMWQTYSNDSYTEDDRASWNQNNDY